MTQQMFSDAVPLRSRCAVYDNYPVRTYTTYDNLLNAYRCALEDRDSALLAFESAKRKLGYANKAKIEGSLLVAPRAAQKSAAMREMNRARAALRRAILALGQAYDAITPADAASVRRGWDA